MPSESTSATNALFDNETHEVIWGGVWGGLIGLSLAGAGLAIGIGITGVAEVTKSFWYLSRSSGFVAYLLLWGSVVWGLLLTTKLFKGKVRPATLLNVHQFLSNLGLGFALFHGLVLLGDRYLSFPLAAVLVPLAGSYAPVLVAFGQVAMWLSLLLILSFYVRRQIGQKAWRLFHYLSFVAYFAVWVHAVLLGTDSPLMGIRTLYAASAGVVIFLTLLRILSPDEAPNTRHVQSSPTAKQFPVRPAFTGVKVRPPAAREGSAVKRVRGEEERPL